jgi:GNAT superfamily N-acetyltransferase
MPEGTYVAWLVEGEQENGSREVVCGGGATIIPWPPGPRHLQPTLAFVYNVYTEPGHRGRGLAKRVMNAIHEFCRAERIGSVALNASTFGQPLYEAMGYRVAQSPMMILSLD